jgi:hypothetical protein
LFSVRGYLTKGGSPQTDKKVLRWNAVLNGWYEIWNGRPIVVSSSVTSSNDGTNLTKLTFTGTIDGLNLSTTFTVSVRVSNSNNAWIVIPGTVLTQYGAQSYSLICYGLIDNTSFDYEVTGINAGGTTKITGSITTNVNCTEGNVDFVPIAVEYSYSEYVGCGICGRKRKVVSRVQYGKSGCSSYYDPASFPNFDTVDYLSCDETGMAPTSNWVLQNASSYGSGYTFAGGITKNDLTGDVRLIVAKEFFGYWWFGDANSAPCTLGGTCQYDLSYTVYKCSLTNAMVWTQAQCFAVFCGGFS